VYMEKKKPKSILYMVFTVIFLIAALLVFFRWQGDELVRFVLSISFAFISWMFSIAANKR